MALPPHNGERSFQHSFNNESILITPTNCDHVKNMGFGTFGIVECVKHRASGHQMALKKINLNQYRIADPNNEYIQPEAEILKLLKGQCRGVVQYYGSLNHDGHLWVYTELMDLSVLELDKLVRTHCGLGVPESILSQIALDMLSALDDMLTKYRVMHRDIKPENVLVNRHGHVKLCDFGFSRIVEVTSHMSSAVGDIYYYAPERFGETTKNLYDYKSDIWSVGLTIYQLAIGKYPFDSYIPRVIESIKNSTASQFELPSGHSKWFQQFIYKCLTHSPSERADYPELLQMIDFNNHNNLNVPKFVQSVLQFRESIKDFKTEFYSES